MEDMIKMSNIHTTEVPDKRGDITNIQRGNNRILQNWWKKSIQRFKILCQPQAEYTQGKPCLQYHN